METDGDTTLKTKGWQDRVNEIVQQVESAEGDHFGRRDIELLLDVKPRTAQRILKSIGVETARGIASYIPKSVLLSWLQNPVTGAMARVEMSRRRKFASWLDRERRKRLERPQCLIESPLHVIDTDIDRLPAGISLQTGEVRVMFTTATECLEKLLALAMAVGNARARFDELVSK